LIGLLQRVLHARVEVQQETIAEIGPGLLVFVGIEKQDDEDTADRLLDKLLAYRIFPDDKGRMNLSLVDAGGGLLLVPQFTLAADTNRGLRPGFSRAAGPGQGSRLFDCLLAAARDRRPGVENGRFGADMRVSLVNDGPVTFSLQV